ncbi:MAG: class I SAM-dependent methyltransferase [Bacteroidales bacterium]|jgi:SAM-dependent methyltransferase|nr:class I SAM-dependent methyltransferase [Bacteroidales bacterium]
MNPTETNLRGMYERRFPETGQTKRNKLWRELCRSFFSRYVSKKDTVLDIAAGYCEFINHIQCHRKIAMDINPDVHLHSHPDVEVMNTSVADLCLIPSGSIDVIFVSNFFEHIDKDTIQAVLCQCHRILRGGGKIIVLQPNIRLAGGAYWDFFDHQTPLTEKSLAEALELAQFKIKQMFPRFLPYTTKSAIPQHPLLVRLYLHFPLAWQLMGKQSLIIAET